MNQDGDLSETAAAKRDRLLHLWKQMFERAKSGLLREEKITVEDAQSSATLTSPSFQLVRILLGSAAKNFYLGGDHFLVKAWKNKQDPCVVHVPLHPTSVDWDADRKKVRDTLVQGYPGCNDASMVPLVQEVDICLPSRALKQSGSIWMDVPGTNDGVQSHADETRDALSKTQLLIITLAGSDPSDFEALEPELSRSPILKSILTSSELRCNVAIVINAERFGRAPMTPETEEENSQTLRKKFEQVLRNRRMKLKKEGDVGDDKETTQRLQERVKLACSEAHFHIFFVSPRRCAAWTFAISNQDILEDFCKKVNDAGGTTPLKVCGHAPVARHGLLA